MDLLQALVSLVGGGLAGAGSKRLHYLKETEARRHA